MFTAISQLSLCGRVSYSLGNTVGVDRHSTGQTHHAGLAEGVVAQVASLLFRHKDGSLTLFQLDEKKKKITGKGVLRCFVKNFSRLFTRLFDHETRKLKMKVFR